MVEYGRYVAVVARVCACTYKVPGETINGMLEKLGKSVDAISKNIK